mmetsp:Transcript_11852/g.25020  ORF Transcript_11852/g.25020 Transcript_11852/m.25020 type:complete len:230 (+) Transcript_11852:55-744(+)
MSREETMPTMRAISSDDRKMRWSFDCKIILDNMCNESPASTETTLKRLRRCERNIWFMSPAETLERQVMNSLTDRSRMSYCPRPITIFKSATDTTLIATTPPKSPESSLDVAGQIVRCSLSMTRRALSKKSSCCTETFSMDSRWSKVRAERDFRTAVGALNRVAKSRKSKQEKTWTTSPMLSTMGTRRTGAPLECGQSASLSFTQSRGMRRRVMRRSTSLSGASGLNAT